MRVNEGDALISVGLTDGKKEILLATAMGMAIRFSESEVRPMGLVAAGVNGIKLDDKDEVVGVEVLPAQGEVFFITTNGKAKRVEQKEFPRQGRYGKGVRAWELPKKVRIAGVVTGKGNWVASIHLSKAAPRSARLDEASLRKRTATRGDHLVELKPGDTVMGVTLGWMVERFIKIEKKEEAPKPKKVAKAKKAASAKKKVGAKKTAAPKKKAVRKKK